MSRGDSSSSDLSNGLEAVCIPALELMIEQENKLWQTFKEYTPRNTLDAASLFPGEAVVTYRDSELLEDCSACSCSSEEAGACGELGSECDCIAESGNFYQDARLLLAAVPPRHILRECTELCFCQQRKEKDCANRSVGLGLRTSLYVAATESCGLGLFAAEAIEAGTFVCEYAGEVIGEAEMERRCQSYAAAAVGAPEASYVLVLQEWLDTTRCLRTIIDPTVRGNIARFANHSCEPNLRLLPVRCDAPLVLQHKESLELRLALAPPRAALFAERRIERDEELRFDYGVGSVAKEADASGGVACACGSSICRGFIFNNKTL